MHAHFVGYRQQGVSWQTPKCPICGYFYPEVKDLLKHFNELHTLGIKWFYVEAEDPRLPGVKFQLIVDDPAMSKALNGKAIEAEKKPVRKAKR